MRSRRTGLASRKLVVIGLSALALALFLIPQRLTGGLISAVQVLAPFIHASNRGLDSLTAAPPIDGTVTVEQFQAVQARQQALEHQVASLSAHANDLERENELLTGTRMWTVDGTRIGARGRLIPAQIVAQDLLPWRDSRLINAGSLQGVSRGLPVTSRYFSINRGGQAGIKNGMGILLAETLVGVVDSVGTHTARVRLLCDIESQMKVRIGRFVEGGLFQAGEQFYWLVGRGCDNMEIREVDRRDVEEGRVAIGDRVLADYAKLGLTAPMVIGRIKAVLPDRDNPLLVRLTVVSPVDLQQIQRVLVFDPASNN